MVVLIVSLIIFLIYMVVEAFELFPEEVRKNRLYFWGLYIDMVVLSFAFWYEAVMFVLSFLRGHVL